MKRLIVSLASMLALCATASAQAPFTLEGKTVTMLVGFAVGGGTDVSGRLLAPFIGKYLPGSPDVIVQNRPGADGLTATNYFAQQVKPDGLTIEIGPASLLDPIRYRKAEAKFDPTKFVFIGGVGRGGSMLVISKEAEKRLLNKNEKPAVIGAPGNTPHATMQAAGWGIEFLGWNAKWVMGYRGTPDIFIALERGEVDMTGTGNVELIRKLVGTGKFKVLVQTGTLDNGRLVGRSEFGQVPMFAALMEGKIKNPAQQKAYDYWYALLTSDKWLALPPDTPAPILEVYREAFRKATRDPEFLERSKKVSQDFDIQSATDVEKTVTTLAATTPDALEFISSMLRKQGIEASN